MEKLSQILEILTFIITIAGVPTAIYVYLKEQKKQRLEREYGTFDALDEKYIEIQQLCIEHPSLDVFDSPYNNPVTLTEEQKKQEEAILLIRIAIFERAYLMYNRVTLGAKTTQWQGWELEIIEWFHRPNFQKVWQNHGKYFDSFFYQHFEKVYNEIKSKSR
ncbi:hypothetical protein [Thalassotalea sediminis]|uniref:hypothetical protein n=1 Tax=Thalassotalea sediminis TaxID=1759089 RepID=UPI002572CA5C|nr:hypothetical protein [Thalassotalea sediminis]